MSEPRKPDSNFSTPGGSPLDQHISAEWIGRMFNSIEKLFGVTDDIKTEVTSIRIKMAEDDHAGQVAELKRSADARDLRIASLETFQTRIVTAFAVVQILFAGALAILGLMMKKGG